MSLEVDEIVEIYGFAMECGCFAIKDVGKNESAELGKADLRAVANECGAKVTKHIRYDQNQRRVIFEVKVGDSLIITKEIVGVADEFEVEPQPKEKIKDGEEE